MSLKVNRTNQPKLPFWWTTSSLVGFALLIVIFDQVSKYLANTQLDYGQTETVFTGFDLLLVYNFGAAFSFLSDAGGWQRILFTVISFVVSILVFVWLIKLPREQKLLGLALAMILGGAVGNLIDRAFLGYVIDFISVYYGEYRFATFNIADSAISVGACLMILDMILHGAEKNE